MKKVSLNYMKIILSIGLLFFAFNFSSLKSEELRYYSPESSLTDIDKEIKVNEYESCMILSIFKFEDFVIQHQLMVNNFYNNIPYVTIGFDAAYFDILDNSKHQLKLDNFKIITNQGDLLLTSNQLPKKVIGDQYYREVVSTDIEYFYEGFSYLMFYIAYLNNGNNPLKMQFETDHGKKISFPLLVDHENRKQAIDCFQPVIDGAIKNRISQFLILRNQK